MPPSTTPYRKKLIEVDLPLDAINQLAAGKRGFHTQMHKWWARRPLALCKAIVFASLVDDPSSCPDDFPDTPSQTIERDRLHQLTQDILLADDDALVWDEAKSQIAKSLARYAHAPMSDENDPASIDDTIALNAPLLHDPFSGGGSIPFAAQSLGLRTIASDLNPVAVLINKAIMEIPHGFRGIRPVNRDSQRIDSEWQHSSGIAADVRYYGRRIHSAIKPTLDTLFPKSRVVDGVISLIRGWIWCRTIECPNPACRFPIPLTNSFQVSKKLWAVPGITKQDGSLSFSVQANQPNELPDGTINRSTATCVRCFTSIPLRVVSDLARANGLGHAIMATVIETPAGRIAVTPDKNDIPIAHSISPCNMPNQRLPERALGFRVQRYGYTHWRQLFTRRQLAVLNALCHEVTQAYTEIVRLRNQAYAAAVCTYLSMAVARVASNNCAFNRWNLNSFGSIDIFSRQTLSMIWNFIESNMIMEGAPSWLHQVEKIAQVLERIDTSNRPAHVIQKDAISALKEYPNSLIITDPPYYDNVGYADLSDFYYVWLRNCLSDIYPDLFRSILSPKQEEMVANPRFEDSHRRFDELMTQTMSNLSQNMNQDFPSSVMYAYKQADRTIDGTTSTGWEVMLNGVIGAGLMICGTWPVRAELPSRQRALGSNALATMVVLVVRRRPENATIATRQEFLDELDTELRIALDRLTRHGHIAPADLPQAAIGPGMEIYSKYSRVETISGETVTVREALQQINRVIGEYFDKEEGELDATSRFCVDWLKTHALHRSNIR